MGTLFSSDRNNSENQRMQNLPHNSFPENRRTQAPPYVTYSNSSESSRTPNVIPDYSVPRQLSPYSDIVRTTTPTIELPSSITRTPASYSTAYTYASYQTNVQSTTLPAPRITPSYDAAIRKKYGYYECSCGAWWESAHSWAHETQDCKQCGENVYPYRQEELRPRNIDAAADEPNAHHREDLCGMCRRLGRSCTLIMSASGNARYPNDVVIRGLPMDITESQIRQRFGTYGTILAIRIPEPRENSRYRIAFVTFTDREIALQRFNDGNVMQQRQRLAMR